jgi:hypothetical protein
MGSFVSSYKNVLGAHSTPKLDLHGKRVTDADAQAIAKELSHNTTLLSLK